MSIAQRAINTSHTDKQWHILFLNTSVFKLAQKSEQCIMQSGIKSKRQQKQKQKQKQKQRQKQKRAFSNQRVLNITEQLPEYQSEMERNKLNQSGIYIYIYIYIYINYILTSYFLSCLLAYLLIKRITNLPTHFLLH